MCLITASSMTSEFKSPICHTLSSTSHSPKCCSVNVTRVKKNTKKEKEKCWPKGIKAQKASSQMARVQVVN